MSGKLVDLSNINSLIKNTKYEVRGEIYLAAYKRAQEGKEVIYTNVGNPHALGQTPITFGRQVISLCVSPFLLKDPRVLQLFPSDVIARAKLYLEKVKSVGAYQDSRGNGYIRQEVKNFIERQPGVKVASIDNIFISNGASEVVRSALNAIIRGKEDGIMTPIPQYPLYSASIGLYGGTLVPYFLEESQGWSLTRTALEESYNTAKQKGVTPRGLVFINPGNPTGQCLTEENLMEIITFCCDFGLVIMADEVYQENVYNSKLPFVSARATLAKMSPDIQRKAEMISFHTVSKGSYGECGMRGGYMEIYNMSQDLADQLYKMSSINLSPNVVGQLAVGIMVNPPKPGDPSYPLWKSERDAVLDSLKRRARRMTDTFNSMEGVHCEEVDGAMYAFPNITLPPKAIEAAKAAGKSPDVFYCLELLNETGLSCVPGSGFQQAPGTFHIRTTILPMEDQFDDITSRFISFHKKFMAKYGGGRSRL